MSTITDFLAPEIETDGLFELRRLLHRVGDAQDLLQPGQLTMRLNVLDKLDAIIGDADWGSPETSSDRELFMLANSLRSRLEAANQELYEAAHAEIAFQGNSSALSQWLTDLANDGEREGPQPGLAFDLLDEIVAGVLQFRGPCDPGFLLSAEMTAEMTAYQPTPARHILDLISVCRFSTRDVLVDLGSGLGHVPLLVNILAGISTFGVEVQPDYAAGAEETARRLNLSHVRFTAEDARTTDLSRGTVFYMFTPFTGAILTDVLDRLHQLSRKRQVRICALGPCTRILQQQNWLAPRRLPDTERITVFTSLPMSDPIE